MAADAYRLMIELLCAGRLPADRIEQVLTEAGLSDAAIVRDVLTIQPNAPQPGDQCEACRAGRLRVYSSRRTGEIVVQYLHCNDCGAKPDNNRRIVLAAKVPRRKKAS